MLDTLAPLHGFATSGPARDMGGRDFRHGFVQAKRADDALIDEREDSPYSRSLKPTGFHYLV